jgi:urease accessory protein UreE
VAVAAPAVLVGGILAAAPVAAQDASAAPAPSAPPALTAEVIEIIGQVEVVRELPVLTEVAWQLGDRETALTEQLDKEIAKPETADRFAQDERILTRLGLVPEGTDLLALTVDTLQGQVAGFFDPETDSLTVLDDDGELDLASRITLAHEVDHAIGDQHWDLQAMKDAIPLLEGDRQSALQALIEGDATLLMTLWSAKHAASDMLGMDESALPGGQSLDGLPQIIQRQLLFPYLDGLTFVMSAWGPRGWAGVDAL